MVDTPFFSRGASPDALVGLAPVHILESDGYLFLRYRRRPPS